MGVTAQRHERILLLTHSAVADDPRIRRHGDTLSAAGYAVSAIGNAGGVASPPDWPVDRLVDGLQRDPVGIRLLNLPSARLGDRHALAAFWRSPANRRLWDQVEEFDADLYIANDWPMLPVAARLANRHGGRYAYDSHEYGPAEHADRIKWRLLYPPYVGGIERALAHRAAAVITVSNGIANLMESTLGLKRRPFVVRNAPPYQEYAFRAAGPELRLLFHGLFAPDRGLEELVASTRLWRDDRRLTLRGFGEDAFVRRLKSLAPEGERVRFEPPAPPQELIPLAHKEDIGICSFRPTTAQMLFNLPNKFFEYLMAGLAVAVTELPEMVSLVREFGVGVTFKSSTPRDIAATVNALTLTEVSAMKTAAQAAAKRLCWEVERESLLDAVAFALDRPTASTPRCP